MNANLIYPKDINEKHWAYANIISSMNDLQKNTEDMTSINQQIKYEVNNKNQKIDISKLEDGDYKINIQMYKAVGENEPVEHSMANNAINHNAVLNVKNNKANIIVVMKGMALKGFGDKKGHLQRAWYYDSKQDYIKSLKESDNSSLYKEVKVLDTFNEVAFESEEIKSFPKDISIPVEIGEKYAYIRVEVDAMRAIGGTGLADAVIKIDWNSIEK